MMSDVNHHASAVVIGYSPLHLRTALHAIVTAAANK
jgi:hypothetical protein